MAEYTIHDLEVLSGVKSNTIRMWERRYSFLKPSRTDTNFRRYSDDDLVRLLNISILKNRGMKISHIANMSNAELSLLIREYTLKQEKYIDDTIEQLSLAMMNFDEIVFNKVLSAAINKYGFEKAFYEKVFKFFDRIGLLWQIGSINPVHEHFVSNIILQKLYTEIDSTKVINENNSKSALFFLPEGELHEISLLYYLYVIKNLGYNIINFGQSLPVTELIETVPRRNLFIVFTAFITNVDSGSLKDQIMQLSKGFKDQQVFVTGHQLSKVNYYLPENIVVVSSPARLKKQLSKTILD